MADDLREKIAELLAGHRDRWQIGLHLTAACSCGWSEVTSGHPEDASTSEAHARHVAEVILAAIGERVLPEGGETREDAGHWSPNRAYVWACGGGGTTWEDCESFAATDPRHPPVSHVMTVTSWSDGSSHYGPWRPVDDDPKES